MEAVCFGAVGTITPKLQLTDESMLRLAGETTRTMPLIACSQVGWEHQLERMGLAEM